MHRILISLFAIPFIAAAADSVVVFTEVQYHPANEGTQTEWVELRNLHGVDVDIAGWRLEGGIDFTFPPGTRIAGGAHVVVAKVPGQIPGALGPFTGQLDNGGEEVRLVNRSDRAMDVLNFSDDGDWPAGADGSGSTLSRRNGYSADGGPAAWSASNQLGGTPGGVNFTSPGDPPTVTTPIALGATWKYRDDNVAPPANWKDIAFDDSAWLSGGALLYAGNPNITGAGEGLHGYWPLQETTGTNVPNVAPGGTNGTIFNGVTWVNDGTRGQVLNFDGVDGYVAAGSIPQPTLANNFTWSFWANSLSTSNTLVVLGNRFSPTNGVDFSPREFVKFTTSAFEFHRNGGGEDVNYADFTTNVWTHHAVVKTGASLAYYRNGVLSNSTTFTQGLNNAQPFYFGGDQVNENWAGRMDDVAVWTKALPAASVTGLANGTMTPLTAPTGSSGGTLTTSLALGPTTHYFRRAFTFSGDKTRTTLALQHMLDDGAVVYLNGVEVLRVNMPGGAVSHGTLATNAITATALSTNINIPVTDLVVGTNVLAVEVHQHTANPDMVFGVSLTATETAGPVTFPGAALVLNEIGGTLDTTFRVELANLTASTVNLADYQLRGSNGASYTLTGTLAAGALLSLDEMQLGFRPLDGERLFIVNTATQRLADARVVTTGLRGRTSAGVWGHPNAATFGTANTFTLHDSVVINEIMYHAPGTSAEEWVELYNKSAGAVDISGWHFTDGISFTFPPGTTLGTGQYALVVWDVAAFNALHPGLPNVFGPMSGGLSGAGERVRLRDADDNLADEVEYFTGGRWPEFADGGGSSLELRNPNADNTSAEAWAASVESGTWVNVQYDFSGVNLEGNPTDYSELLVGMIAGGEAYIDDLEVIENPLGSPISLLQNGNFSGGTAASWRFQGNHRTSVVVDDPISPGNKVLKIVATGYTEHMSNHCETTLRNGATLPWPINAGRTYRIKYRARWAGGGNRLQTRLYFNRGARQEMLPMPATGGTPGLQNSRFIANTGPTFKSTTHSPVVPAALQAATVSTRITDSDGVASATLNYSLDGITFNPLAMSNNSGVWSATVPGQALNAKVVFYIQAADTLGASATFPANGGAGRAMIPWNDNQALLTLPTGVSPHNIRIVMTTSDANNSLLALNNVMSNEYRPCTVIYDERDIYYGAGVHLKGSEHGRAKFSSRTGFHLSFSPDQLFLGQHSDVAADRSGAGDQFSQKEMLVKRTLNAVGGIPASEDDLCRLIAPGVATGPAILIKAKVDSNEFLENWLPNGGDGTFFEYELVYSLFSGSIATSTDNGTWEGNKLTQDGAVSGIAVRALSPGLSKEEYRWFWLIKNNRSADNYAPLITALTALGQPGGEMFITQTNALLDVDGWLRDMAGPVAWSAGDNYAFSLGPWHNALFFVKPDGRLLFVPWDMDFTATQGATAGITGINTEMDKLLASPANRRAYYGHLLDLCNRAFNTGYLTYWAQHYTKFVNEDLTSFMGFVGSRETHIRNTIAAAIPNVAFAFSPAPPASVASDTIALTGTGWVDIREFRRADTGAVLPATWTGNTIWSLSYALVPGPNAVSVQAYNYQGALLGTVNASVTNTLTPPQPKDWLRITELHYHPAAPTGAELAASTDKDDFEFIELRNFASQTLDIGGCKFIEGVDFTFPNGTTLAAGERIMVVRNVGAFHARYGAVPRIAGAYGPADALSNGGEMVTLVDATGAVIQSFTYGDALPWPANADGKGYSLVAVSPGLALNSALPENWRASAAIGGNPGSDDSVVFSGAPGADGDGDLLSGFLEYALGRSDSVPDVQISTLQREPSGTYLFAFQRALNADDVAYLVQSASSPAGAWDPANAILMARTQSGVTVFETWRITPSPGAPSLLVRLRATLR